MRTDEMIRLRDARPEPPHASQAAKAQARDRLLASIDSAGGQPDFRRHLPRVRLLLPAVGATVTLAVTVTVVVFLAVSLRAGHDRGTAGEQQDAAGRGAILAGGGQILAATHENHYLTVVVSGLPQSISARAAEARRAVRLVYGSASAACLPRSTEPASQLGCRITQVPSRPGTASLFTASHPVLISAQTATAIRAAVSHLPGLRVSSSTVRAHPSGTTAAAVLGVTTTSRGGTLIGQSGLEFEYNSELTAGETLKTSINLALQQVGERSLATSLRHIGSATADATFIAMNPNNGQVYAMGTATSRHRDHAPGDPAIARATPPGSLFKPVTAIAALESGNWQVNERFDDTGEFCASGQCFSNAPGDGALGPLDLQQAITVSDDDFFYNLGARLNADPITNPNGGQLQRWGRAFGIGRPTGIDLPDAADGTLPTPASIAPTNWTIGDNLELAIGEGDLGASPLQIAVAYAALANGGAIVTPHVGTDIENATRTAARPISPGIRRHLDIRPQYLQTVLAGLRAAASTGTSADVMKSFPEPVYGKTGTTNTVQNGVDTASAWYAAFVPTSATTKPIVVIVSVPGGGYGDVAAAPVARQILSQWFTGKPGPYIAGTSTSQ